MAKKLLIITQKIDKDDQILGFFHRWVAEFSLYFNPLTVICLEQGKNELPDKIKVLSLGKESHLGKVKYLFNFYRYLWQEQNNYDMVFVHMNPIYIVLAGIYWRFKGKKIALWYTHKRVDWKLRLAEKLAHVIFSASTESFRLPSKKLIVTGHGIDVEVFCPKPEDHKSFTILSVGRLMRTKNHHLLIEAVSRLPILSKPWQLLILGEAIYPEDLIYKKELIDLIAKNGLEKQVKLLGAVSPNEIIKYYQLADLLINLSDTGSLDKVVLEAMACGLKIISSNEAYANILAKESFTVKDPMAIATAIIRANDDPFNHNYRKYVEDKHNLKDLIKLLTQKLKSL